MILIFLISLYICIILHEFAHLIIAKKVGCKVLVFSIGFGLPLYKKIYKGTIYQLALFPLGGYCKLAGELVQSKKKNEFANLPYIKKFYLIIAGCVMNIITGGISLILGNLLNNYNLIFFGILSLALGLSNLCPIPALDGGYIVYLPLCLKLWGKEKGYKIFAKITQISFYILIAINVACIPYLVYIFRKGGF